MNTKGTLNNYLRIFLLSFFTAAGMILPFIIIGRGIFYIAADFNVQTIPFNILSINSIKNGDVFWNWNTDLGSSFIGAYSILLGSPFFWLSLIFPADWFPYIVGPLLILKFAVAGLTSYAYIKRYVNNERYALIGALLYAFSGFQICNMIFGGFHDVVAFFPLLLLALDESINSNKKGWFALAVALCALTSYFFFVGEVVFLFIYFLIKVLCREFKLTFKKLILLAWESILGVGISFIILLPSVLFVMQNPRTQSRLGLNIWSLIYYPDKYLNILKAFLLPSEAMIKRSIIIPVDFVSCEAYLPLVGIILALVYCLNKKKDWLSISIYTCSIIACVPILNSMFYLFNATYYARWYYMFILLLSLASCKAFEQEKNTYKYGLIAYVSIVLLFIATMFIWSTLLKVTTFYNIKYLIMYVLIAVTGVVLYIVLIKNKEKAWFARAVIICIMIISIISGIINIAVNQAVYPEPEVFTRIFTKLNQHMVLPDEENYRIDTIDALVNTNIIINKPAIHAFHSTVSGSIFDFYNSIGIDRVVSSVPPYDVYGLRPFLSTKYLLSLKRDYNLSFLKNNDITRIPNIKVFMNTDDYIIYESSDYIPLGYTFDKYVLEEEFNCIDTDNKHLALLKAIVLNEHQSQKYKDLLSEIPKEQLYDFSVQAYESDIANRKSETCYYFDRYNTGFTARIKLKKDNLVFFSIPYDEGWSATVNGKPADIEKVDFGFIAVKGSAGDNLIRFTFMPSGLMVGAIVSGISVVLSLIYFILASRRENEQSIVK